MEQTANKMQPHPKQCFQAALAKIPRSASGACNSAAANKAIPAPPAAAAAAAAAAVNPTSGFSGTAELQVRMHCSVVTTCCFYSAV
jgi:hypothetical protein